MKSFIFAFAVFAVLAQARAETSEEVPVYAPARPYVFKPIKIDPSPSADDYTGHFRFVHRESKPVSVPIFDPPIRGKITPEFVAFERFEAGVWKDLKIGYCGTGIIGGCSMKSREPYEFICDLSSFQEQDTPLTARIRVHGSTSNPHHLVDFTSEPFVLDWAKDRANGEFAAAKTRNLQAVRSAFIKAGFKSELLEGDDFCERLLRSVVVKATDAGREDGFVEFQGKLATFPTIEFSGNIRIDFASEDENGGVYRGLWVVNPNRFNSNWFEKTARKHVKASRSGAGVQLELDDGSLYWRPDARFYFRLECVQFRALSVPTDESAKRAMLRVLDNLKSCLEEGRLAPLRKTRQGE